MTTKILHGREMASPFEYVPAGLVKSLGEYAQPDASYVLLSYNGDYNRQELISVFGTRDCGRQELISVFRTREEGLNFVKENLDDKPPMPNFYDFESEYDEIESIIEKMESPDLWDYDRFTSLILIRLGHGQKIEDVLDCENIYGAWSAPRRATYTAAGIDLSWQPSWTN